MKQNEKRAIKLVLLFVAIPIKYKEKRIFMIANIFHFKDCISSQVSKYIENMEPMRQSLSEELACQAKPVKRTGKDPATDFKYSVIPVGKLATASGYKYTIRPIKTEPNPINRLNMINTLEIEMKSFT